MLHILISMVLFTFSLPAHSMPKASLHSMSKIAPKVELTSAISIDESWRISPEEAEMDESSLHRSRPINLELEEMTNQAIERDDHEKLVTLSQRYIPSILKRSRETFAQIAQTRRKENLKFEIVPNDTLESIFTKAFQHYDHLFIGEVHQDYSPKKLLIENMENIQKHNACLALEHVPRYPYQELYDQYLATQSEAPMPEKLKDFLLEQDSGHFVLTEPKFRKKGIYKYGYYSLVVAAKLHHIPLIFFETDATQDAGYSRFGEHKPERLEVMNYVEKVTVDELRKGRKVIHLVGSAHIHTRGSIVGLSEMNESAPTVVISDVNVLDEHSPALSSHIDQGIDGIIADILLNVKIQS